MRAVVQRVTKASVLSEGALAGQIGRGLCVLVGVTHADDVARALKLADKIWHLRIFEDDGGKMNRSAADLDLDVLVVSQFTLYGDCTRGRRPSFVDAAAPEHAEPLIDALVSELSSLGANVATGRFRTDMKLALVNDGPVTVMVET